MNEEDKEYRHAQFEAPSGIKLPLLDNQIVKDAETAVFKAFGASRKLSERDKRHLAKVIAVNSQLLQRNLTAEADELMRQVNAVKQRRRRLERNIASLNSKIAQFLDNNKDTLVNKLVDRRSTTDVLQTGKQTTDIKERDVIQQLENNVQLVLDKFSRLVIEALYLNGKQPPSLPPCGNKTGNSMAVDRRDRERNNSLVEYHRLL